MDIHAHLDIQRPCAFLHAVWINVEGKNMRDSVAIDEEKEDGEGKGDEREGKGS